MCRSGRDSAAAPGTVACLRSPPGNEQCPALRLLRGQDALTQLLVQLRCFRSLVFSRAGTRRVPRATVVPCAGAGWACHQWLMYFPAQPESSAAPRQPWGSLAGCAGAPAASTDLRGLHLPAPRGAGSLLRAQPGVGPGAAPRFCAAGEAWGQGEQVGPRLQEGGVSRLCWQRRSPACCGGC